MNRKWHWAWSDCLREKCFASNRRRHRILHFNTMNREPTIWRPKKGSHKIGGKRIDREEITIECRDVHISKGQVGANDDDNNNNNYEFFGWMSATVWYRMLTIAFSRCHNISVKYSLEHNRPKPSALLFILTPTKQKTLSLSPSLTFPLSHSLSHSSTARSSEIRFGHFFG